MAVPTRYLIDALRKLGGDGFVSYPDKNLDVRRVERVFRVRRNSPATAFNSPQADEYTDTELVDQHVVGGDAQYVEIYQAWETLPGSELTTKIKRDDVFSRIPVELRSSAESLTIYDQPVEPGTNPDAIAGNVVESIINQESRAKAHRRTTLRDPSSYRTAHHKSTTADQLLATTDVRAIDDGASIVVPTARVAVDIKDIGGGKNIEAVTTVPETLPAVTDSQEQTIVPPRKFLTVTAEATHEETVESTAVTPDALGTNGLGVVRSSATQRTKFTGRKAKTTRTGTAASTVTEYRVNKEGQVVTRASSYGTDGSAPAAGALVEESEVEALGDGKFLRTAATVPSLFTKATYESELPDLLPREFQAALVTRETSAVEAGTASQPALGVGDLNAKEEQLTVQLKRIRRKNRDTASLPATLTGKRVLGDGRQATVTKRLAVGDQTITAGARTVSGEVDALGDGTTLKAQVEADEALPQASVAREQTAQPPRKFLSLTSDETTESILESASVAPDALGTDGLGVVEASSKQIEKFRGSKRTRTRVGTAAGTVTEYRLNKEALVVTKASTYGTDGSAPSPSLLIEEAEVEALGDGKFLRSVASVSAYPLLSGTEIDETLHKPIPFTTQTVTAGTTGGVAGDVETEIKPLDAVRSQRIIRTFPTGDIASYSRILHNNCNLNLPLQLMSIAAYAETHGGAGAASAVATAYTLGGNGSGSLELDANCQASAAIVVEAGWVLRAFRDQGLPCFHVLFFVADGTNRASILSALGTILGNAVSEYPSFSAQPVTLHCTGQQTALRQGVSQKASSSTRVKYDGTIVSTGEGRSQANSVSYEVGVNQKVIHLPPSIHGVIGISGGTDPAVSNFATSIVNATAFSGPITTLSNFALAAGSIRVAESGTTSTLATPGVTTMPSSGLYLTQRGIVSEPDRKFNRIRVFAEVVDFAHVI